MDRYYFEREASHPEAGNFFFKQSGWVWKEKGKIVHISLNGCKEFNEDLGKVKAVVDGLKLK